MNDESVIDDKERLLTNPNQDYACSIIKSVSGNIHTEETVVYIKNIVKYLEKFGSLFFHAMTVDFIKDENDRWWVIGIENY